MIFDTKLDKLVNNYLNSTFPYHSNGGFINIAGHPIWDVPRKVRLRRAYGAHTRFLGAPSACHLLALGALSARF